MLTRLTVFFAFLIFCSAQTILVTPVSVTSATVGNGPGIPSAGGITDDSDFYPVDRLLNAPSITLANFATTSGGDSNTGVWVTGAPNGGSGDYFNPTPTPSPSLDFQLSQQEDIQGFIAWGYQTNGNCGTSFELQFSVDGCATMNPGSVMVTENALTGRPSILGGLLLDLGGTFPANCVRVNILDNGFGSSAGGGDRVGLGEVRFTAASSLSPGTPPGTSAIMPTE